MEGLTVNSVVKIVRWALGLSMLAVMAVCNAQYDQSDRLSNTAARLERMSMFADACPLSNPALNTRLEELKREASEQCGVRRDEMIQLLRQRAPMPDTYLKFFSTSNKVLFLAALGLTGLVLGGVQSIPQYPYFSTYQCLSSACAAVCDIAAMTIQPALRDHIFNDAGLNKGDRDELIKENPSLKSLTESIEKITCYLEKIKAVQGSFVVRTSRTIEGEKLMVEWLAMAQAVLEKKVPEVRWNASLQKIHGLWLIVNLFVAYKSIPISLKGLLAKRFNMAVRMGKLLASSVVQKVVGSSCRLNCTV